MATADDQAGLFRRLPDQGGEENHELTAVGSLRECAVRLRNIDARDRDNYFAELADGLRVTAEDVLRIAENETD